MSTVTDGFEIDGHVYPIPTWDTFDMDEAQDLYENTGFAIEDLIYDPKAEDADAVQARFSHPGTMRTLMQVAYQRGNPNVTRKAARELIGRSNYAEALVTLLKRNRGDQAPLAPTASSSPTPLPPSSSPDSETSNGPSGNGSETSSDAPDVPQPTTATPESPTSSESPETEPEPSAQLIS